MIGHLVLESGECYSGELINASEIDKLSFERAGEVVFNTSNTGYEEIATDPSYYSQIVVLTAPQQGNYGISKDFWESSSLHIQGFIALDIQRSSRDSDWMLLLKRNSIPVIRGIDTRGLTKRLRSGGTPWGAVVVEGDQQRAVEKAHLLISKAKDKSSDWVYAVSSKKLEVVKGEFPLGPKVAVLDFGSKKNILRLLQKYSNQIAVFNSRASASDILASKSDAIILTNGPGDPSEVHVAPETVRSLIGHLPMFGICMGHQILSIALGAKTYKLKFGHRGSNHPIQDNLLNRIYVSSQNHGYAVDSKSLPADVQVTQVNLNDNSVAGIYSKERSLLGIQYHPEACPGPHEAQQLFDYFFNKIVPNFKRST